MANGMPSWEQWNNLDKKAQDYKLYETLTIVTEHLKNQCPARHVACDARFKTLEKRKWLDRGAALAGGFVSGVLGALGIKWGG